MKKLFSALVLFFSFAVFAMAVPAYPGLLTKTQPDGSTISYYLRGDESFNFSITEDGYLIALNEDGVFEYAELNDQKEFIPVGIKVSDIANRTYKEKRYLKNALTISDLVVELQECENIARAQQRAKTNIPPVKRYPLKGSPTSLVILVNFSDVEFQKTKEEFTALLNEPGYSVNGGTGSAKDFFREASFGQFDPNFVVVGPYTLPESMSFYGKDFSIGSSRNENNAAKMIVDACKLADEDVDFREYDTDGDGFADNIFVYYAGYNQAEGGGENAVWPHRSQIVNNKQSFDGIQLKDYACTSELKGRSGTTMCGIGTFCHEFGHVLSLPDFYVTNYSHSEPTLESWDAMDAGPYNNEGRTPPSYSSYERFYLGWLTPTILEPNGVFELKPLLSSNTAYILAKETPNLDGKNPAPAEFFMIENRQREGWDSIGLPGEGMLVTHIDYNYSDWEYNTVNNDPNDMGVTIVCADETTREPRYNTYPGESDVTTCFITMKDGYKFPNPLASITQLENGTISFIYGVAPGVPNVVKEGIDFDQFATDYGTPRIDTIKFMGASLASDVEFRLMSGTNFKMRELGAKNFGRGATIKIAEDSTLNCAIEFLYDPRQVTEKDQFLTDKLTITADNYEVFYDLKGIATKAIRISRPVALPATDVTFTDFMANWEEQEHATRYYLSVYSISDKEGREVETFDVFTEEEMPYGWSTNFYTTSKMYTASSPISIQFKDSTDMLYTKEYFSDVDKISVWVHSHNTNGTFFVEGLIDGEWVNVLTEKITTTVRKKTVEASLNGKKCRQFRMYYYKAVQSAGGLLLDDFTAIVSNAPEFVVEDRVATNSGYKVTGLKNDKIYYYRVAASDKNSKLKEDPNEAISTYSNEIKVDLLGGVGVENVYGAVELLSIEYLADGSVLVDLGEMPSFGAKISIYSVDGRLVEEVEPQIQTFILRNLVENNIYVVKYYSDANQVVKIAKLVY